MSIKDLLVPENSSLKETLKIINNNGYGLCFVVDENQKILGVLTDGDIRRGLIKNVSQSLSILDLMNRDFISLTINTTNEKLLKTLNKKIKVIPLIDENQKVIDFATQERLRKIPVSEPLLKGNELAYVTDCIKTTWISSKGKYVDQFQEQFKQYCQVPHALAVSNGTVALHLAIEALGIGNGDEIIVPNLTFAASINAVLHAGATPVIADINPKTLNISIASIKKLISPKTKAIMPVHLYGYPCDMYELMQVAKENNLLIIEDCAEALGSRYKGKPIGSFGDAATFSFFGNKTITTGEGGMVLFKNEEVASKASVLKDHGMSKNKRYWHEYVGYNYRMTNLQAAIGVAQMERIDDFVKKKRSIAATYYNILKDIPFLFLPLDSEEYENSFWLYTIIINQKVDINQMITNLLKDGIETRPIFYPLNIMPPYKSFCKENSFPNTMSVTGRGISLPSSTNLSLEEARLVATKVRKYLT